MIHLFTFQAMTNRKTSKFRRSVFSLLAGTMVQNRAKMHLLVLFIFLCSTKLFSQSYWTGVVPYSNDPYRTSFYNDNVGYGIGSTSGDDQNIMVRKTTDGGRTWKATALQFTPQSGWATWNVSCFSPDLVYVGPYKTTNGGELWVNTMPSYTPSGFPTTSVVVSFFNETEGMAARGGKLFKTTDGGDNWALIKSFSGNITTITFRGAFNRLCVTFSNQPSTYRSNDGGITLQSGENPGWLFDFFSFSSTSSYSNIKFFDSNRGILVRGSFGELNLPFLWVTSNGGQTWAKAKTGTCDMRGGGGNLFTSLLGGTGYIQGQIAEAGCTYSNTTLFKTTDYGFNWTPVFNGSESLNFVYAFSPTQIQATTPIGNPRTSTDGGDSWAPTTSEEFNGIQFVDDFQMLDDNTWIVFFRKDAVFPNKTWHVQRTSNAGASWSNLEDPVTNSENQNPFLNRYVFKGLDGYRTTSSGRFFTSNGGSSWSSPLSGTTINAFLQAEMPRTNRFFCLISGSYKRVERSGTNLTVSDLTFTSTAPDAPNPQIAKLNFFSEDIGVGLAGNDLFKTTDGGSSWSLVTADFPFENRILRLKMASPDLLFYTINNLPTDLNPSIDLYSTNITTNPTTFSKPVIPDFTDMATNNKRIMDLDMLGNRGILITSDGTIIQTTNGWESSNKINQGSQFVRISKNTTDPHYLTGTGYLKAGETRNVRYYDRDLDGFGGTEFYYKRPGPPLAFPFSVNSETFADCDDLSSSNKPGAADDNCDGIDNNCNGLVDEDATYVVYYPDNDGDGFGNPSGTEFCSNPGSGYVLNGNDCDDSNPSIGQKKRWYEDADGDGYGNPAISVIACEAPSFNNYVLNFSDCNDNNPLEYNTVWFLDQDQDGFGTESLDPTPIPIAPGINALNVVFSCVNPSTDEIKYVRNRRDCFDGNPMISPRQFENNTDGQDNDCDGLIDEGVDPPGTTYCDIDGDGFGDPGCPIPPAGRMVQKNGHSTFVTSADGVDNNTDCDDTNPNINPSSFEFANGLDNDCNGVVSDTVAVEITWFLDSDSDGYGDGSINISKSSMYAEPMPAKFQRKGVPPSV